MTADAGKFHFRLVLLGSHGTGKTSILNRFLFKKFETKYRPTVEDLFCKDFDLGSIEIKVDFLDTSGSMQFPAMRRLSITTGSAFLIVYSLDDESSYEVLKMCIAEIQEIRPDFQEIPIVFAGNKCDIPRDRRRVPKEVVSNYVHYELPRLRAKVIECSCRDNINIDNLFKAYLSLAKVSLSSALSASLKNNKSSSITTVAAGLTTSRQQLQQQTIASAASSVTKFIMPGGAELSEKLPDEIFQLVESFKKFIREQKAYRDEKFDVDVILEVGRDTEEFTLAFQRVAVDSDRNSQLVKQIKDDTTKLLRHSELAYSLLRSHFTNNPSTQQQQQQQQHQTMSQHQQTQLFNLSGYNPNQSTLIAGNNNLDLGGLNHNQFANTSTSQYFADLADQFEAKMKAYGEQIKELKMSLDSVTRTYNVDELFKWLKKQHETLGEIAAKIYMTHERIMEKKSELDKFNNANNKTMNQSIINTTNTTTNATFFT